MIAESSEHNATSVQKAKEQYEHAKEQYGFNVTFIEDNSVHVQDALGHEVAFEFPLGNVSLEEYDKFIQQMTNAKDPLPSIEAMNVAIHKPYTNSGKHPTSAPNSITYPYTWERHANEHSVTIDEMKAMYFFARQLLYEKFKSRLRK